MAERELSESPATLPLLAKAAAALVPGASRLPFVSGGGGELPPLTLVLAGVRVDRDRLAAYDRVCGFALRDELPSTFLHVLAFPLQLALMTDGGFPFQAVGLVHIRNRIVQHRPVRAGETLTVRVSLGALGSHPRGRQFSLLSEARVGDELVWEEDSVNLRRGGGSGAGSSSPSERRPADELPASAEWRLPGDLGRRYAAVSGDRNPIHMHPLSARLFGFPSAIAHGMWTLARCLAALEARLPDAYVAEASFRKPILLPGKVAFAEALEEGAIRFTVRDTGTALPHLDGRVSFG